MVIDEQIVVAGSFIDTQPANTKTDHSSSSEASFSKVENIEVDATECQALAKHMKAEIERIVASAKTHTS